MRILRILLIFAFALFAQSVFAEDLGEADLRALGITDGAGALPPLTSNSVNSTWIHGPIYYDGSGNIVVIGSQTFLYDKQNRLTRAEITRPDQPGSQVETYTYDPFGNMTWRKRNAIDNPIPTASATNRLTGFWPAYDAAGNLTRWQGENGQVYLARYDALNRLQELKLDNTTDDARHVYLYTADGERIWSWNVYANVSEWNLRGPDNKVLRTFINAGTSWSLDRDYVYRDGQMLAAITPTQTLHFSLDHLGTPRVITDDSRIRVGFHHYFPFGEEWSIGDGTQEGEHEKFTGHERDTDIAGAATGLDYMHARYYRAGVGRFLSVDPVTEDGLDVREPQRWNRYSYAMNNPQRYVDPDGKSPALVIEVGGSAVLLLAAAVYHVHEMNTNPQYRQAMTELTADLLNTLSKATGNQRSDEFANWTTQQLLEAYRRASGDYRRKLEKELKARDEKNKGKARGGKREQKKPKQNDGNKNKSSLEIEDDTLGVWPDSGKFGGNFISRFVFHTLDNRR
jgi:RHS repeat-associated protein